MTVARMPSDLVLAKTAALFSAFANEGRLRALVALSRHGPMAVSNLRPFCGLEQSALSHQLGILRRGGLVVTERRGKQVVYALADEHVRCLLDDGLDHAGESARSKREQQ